MDFYRQIGESPFLIAGLVILVITALLLTLIAVPWFVSRLPRDYLTAQYTGSRSNSPAHVVLMVIRSTFGLMLIALGLVMLITPGPGLVMIVAGISLTDFPGKHRLVVSLASRQSMLRSLNWMRRRYNKPPLDSPGDI